MNLPGVIAGSGALLGLLLSAALLAARGGNRVANRVLAVFMLALSIYLISLVFIHSHWLIHSAMLPLGVSVIFLNGPLLYTYVRAMTERDFRLQPRDALHTLPLALVLMLQYLHVGWTPGIEESLRQSRGGWPPTLPALLGLAYYGTLVLYCLASLRRLRRHEAAVMNEFSYLRGVSLRWLRVLCSVCLAIAVLGLLIALLRLSDSFQLWPRGIYSMLLMLAVFYLIAFAGIAQPEIFSHAPSNDAPPAAAPRTAPDEAVADPVGVAVEACVVADVGRQSNRGERYRTSTLTEEQAQHCWLCLQALMAHEKPYRQNELRIADLAAMLEVPANHLSQVINQMSGRSFFSFINEYRVLEAQALLANTSLKLSNIALDAGFNSESTFYKQFRQATGLTPRQFRRQHASGPHPA